MSQANVRKPIRSRLGLRRTMNFSTADFQPSNGDQSSANGSLQVVSPSAPSNSRRGVNKCLFGNKGNDLGFRDPKFLLIPTEAHHYRSTEKVRNNVVNGKSSTQFRENAERELSKNHLSKITPFATPRDKGDDFPDLESREKDDNYVWSAFKTKKANLKSHASAANRNLNVSSTISSKREQSRTTKNEQPNDTSGTSAAFHRLLQYQSGVLQSPKAPSRLLSYRNLKIEEPIAPRPSSASVQFFGADDGRRADEEKEISNGDRTVNAENDSTNSFIANETSMAEFNDSPDRSVIAGRSKLSTIPEHGSLDKTAQQEAASMKEEDAVSANEKTPSAELNDKKSTPASVVRNSGVISTKIRRRKSGGGRRSINFTPRDSAGGSKSKPAAGEDTVSLIEDIVRRQEKMDGLLKSYLSEKGELESRLEKLFAAIGEGRPKSPLTENTLKKKKVLTVAEGTPGATNARPNHRQQSYAALRASYTFLRTPVLSARKDARRQTCYTPHSLSMCVEEQMKDIYGE